jgi:predicted RNA binding protein YcfA (HicA-like mRNA interferase family)
MPSKVRFSEVRKMLAGKGYRLDRIRGSHHIFVKAGSGLISIPVHGDKVNYDYVRKIEKLD